jgi:hypothetical protein
VLEGVGECNLPMYTGEELRRFKDILLHFRVYGRVTVLLSSMGIRCLFTYKLNGIDPCIFTSLLQQKRLTA